MEIIEQRVLTGERALFKSRDLEITNSIFKDGESPLKESKNINISNTVFEWKYPLWYCNNILVEKSTFLETARSGIWYTNNITIKNSTIDAPKTFRRGKDITLVNVNLPNAIETLWNCDNVKLNNVTAKGNYFAMNSSNIEIDGLNLSGNYAFDSARNIEIHNARLISKDAFWNCENVIVNNSTIIGEYLGWNSKNLTFIDCYIQSEQGLCYVENLKIRNSEVINTDLAFEYSNVDAEITTRIDSIKNPICGVIKAKAIDRVIIDDKEINPKNIKVVTEVGDKKYAV